MTIKKHGLIFLVIFLLVIQLASAATSFSYVTTESPGQLCPRQSGLFKVAVKNLDSTSRQFTSSLSGSAASWSTAFPANFILASQETKEVYIYSTPTTTVKPGNYNLDLNLGSGIENDKATNSVAVKDCYGLGLETTKSSESVCPGDIAKYEVNVANQGEYTETFKLSLEGQLKDKASLSDKTVTLNKGASKTVLIYINSPSDLAGEYGLTLAAESESGRSKNSLPLALNVNPCYDFKFNSFGESSYDVCERTITTVQLRLENKGTTLNEYYLELKGPIWARMNKKELSLFPNEVKFVDLVMAPDYGVEGDFDVKVTAVPKRGEFKAKNELNVKVRKCNSVDVTVKQKEVKACKGINNDFQVNVKNNGENAKVFRAELEAPNWMTLNSISQFDLKTGEEKTLFVRAMPTSDTEEKQYGAKVKVVAADDSAATANDDETLNVEVADQERCYKPLVTTLYDNVAVYYDSSVSIPLTLKNDGFLRADYNLLLSGNAMDFVKLTTSKVSLDPSGSETVYLYVAPSPDLKLGDYNAFVTLNLNDGPVVYSKEFKLEVTDVKEKATNIPPPATAAAETESVKDKMLKYFGRGSNLRQFLSENKIQLVAGTILVLILVLSFVLGWHKSFIEFFEEEEFETKTEKKNGNKSNGTSKEKKKSSKKKTNSEEAEEIKDNV